MWPRNPYYQFKRVKEIVSVFIKYGFYNQLRQIGLLKYFGMFPMRKNLYNNEEQLNRGQRVGNALEELGPTFIKLGQILSTRREILPKDVIAELESLQDRVAPISFEKIKEQVESELQGDLQDLFQEFDKNPLASASIAQVHKAILKNGQRVVVKIQRPDIEKKVSPDVAIIEEIAAFLDNHTKYGKLYNFTELAKDFRRTLYKELDFRIEGRNIITFRQDFKNNKDIIFPALYKDYSTKKILTMEYIQGISLRNIQLLHKKNLNPSVIAKRLSTTFLEQILKNGFFHGDPHPGNIKVLSNNRIVFLDMGIVGRLGEERRILFLKMIAGITLKNNKLIIQGISEIGSMGESIDLRLLENEINDLRDKYLEVPLQEIHVGEVLSEIFQMAYRYKIRIPNDFTMIAKTLITLEGLVAKLDPQLNIIETAQPLTRKLMLDVYSPKRIVQGVGENILDYTKFLRVLPSSLLNILNRFDHNDLHMFLQFKNEDKIIRTLNKFANQLSFSVALLALSIVIGAFIIGVSLQGDALGNFGTNFIAIGLVASVVMGLWLFISIIKTGRF